MHTWPGVPQFCGSVAHGRARPWADGRCCQLTQLGAGPRSRRKGKPDPAGPEQRCGRQARKGQGEGWAVRPWYGHSSWQMDPTVARWHLGALCGLCSFSANAALKVFMSVIDTNCDNYRTRPSWAWRWPQVESCHPPMAGQVGTRQWGGAVTRTCDPPPADGAQERGQSVPRAPRDAHGCPSLVLCPGD